MQSNSDIMAQLIKRRASGLAILAQNGDSESGAMRAIPMDCNLTRFINALTYKGLCKTGSNICNAGTIFARPKSERTMIMDYEFLSRERWQ